ncbi:unnamed protein product [Diamesa serratosioi]
MANNNNNEVVVGREKIATIVFFDLETSGLPDLEFYRTKITEISLVACSVDHLLSTFKESVPRVLHKLTLCFNPYKRIQLEASSITGLTNELLEQDNKFDTNAMTMIECFINKLQQPVCLIAHNGNKFDFPLLKKQYDLLNGHFPENLRCCDSLLVFQQLELKIEDQVRIMHENYRLKLWDDSLSKNFVITSELEILLDQSPIKKEIKSEQTEEENSLFFIKEELDSITQQEERDSKNKRGIELTMQQINETTPDKATEPMNSKPKINMTTDGSGRKKSALRSSSRELFPALPSSSTNKPKYIKGKFTLNGIYKRIFGQFPDNGHNAESDVIALLKCAVAYKKDFIEVTEQISVNFKDIKKF